MNRTDKAKLDNFARNLMGNDELLTKIRFLNTYLDESGKTALGRVMSILYKQGYEDCVADLWEDVTPNDLE